MELIAEFDTRGTKFNTVDVIRQCVDIVPCRERVNELQGFYYNGKFRKIGLLQVRKVSKNIFCVYKNDYVGEC